MKSHQEIDERSLELARLIAARIDSDPAHGGVDHARRVLDRWSRVASVADHEVWREILAKGWPEARVALLDPGERGRRLRQSSPFCGIVTPRERWRLWKRYRSP